MADMRTTIRSAKVKYVNNNKNKDLNASYETSNIIFNESYVYNQNDKSEFSPIDKDTSTVNNNTIELVTVKIVPSPPKNKTTYVDNKYFDKSTKDKKEKTKVNENNIVLNKHSKTNLDNNNTHESEIKNKKSVIKVKVIVPKNNKENEMNNSMSIIQTTDLDDYIEIASSNVIDSSKVLHNDIPNESHYSADIFQSIDDCLKNYSNKCLQTTDLDDIFDQNDAINKNNSHCITDHDRNECIFEENKIRPLSPIKLETENIIFQEDSFKNLQKNNEDFNNTLNHTKKSEAIFQATKNQPLSPISIERIERNFPKVEDLVTFHERQSELNLDDSYKRYSLPIMGRATLLAKVKCMDESALNDSEIIHKLVHDRFIVNTFASRTTKKPPKKPTRYGRIYKSLERKLKHRDNEKLSKTIHTDIISNENSGLNSTILSDINETEVIAVKMPINESTNKMKECYLKSNVVLISELDNQEIKNTKNPPNSVEDLRNSSSTVFEEMLELNKKDYSTFGSEYRSASQFSDNCNSTDDFSSFSGYITPTNFKFHKHNNVIPEESRLNEDLFRVNITDIDDVPSKENKENTVGTEASYDMDDFLKKALGEELINEVSSYIAQDEQKPIESKQLLPEDSICTSDASDLISKINSFRSSFYRSLTKRLRNMSHSMHSGTSTCKESSVKMEDELNSILPNNEKVNELVRQAAVQYEAMKQISKALTLCRNTKEFSSSEEQIEGERLLLLAIHRRQELLNEIRRLDYELVDHTPIYETGSVTITDLSFSLKRSFDHETRKDHRQWFVCLISQGAKVFATKCVLAKDLCTVSFDEELTFTELASDFIINLEIYSLLQRRSARNFSHESKFHLNKDIKSATCPVPRNIIHRNKLYQKSLTRADTGIHTSSFKLNGALQLRVFDIIKTGPFQMRKVPLSSNLDGTVNLRIHSQVKILIKHNGFLTIGRNIGSSISWNRRWCSLKGNLMYFWNYPCEEDSAFALEIIDLRRCMNAFIEPVDRTICSRPRTLLLETIETNVDVFDKHFINFDTVGDMKTWEEQLNKVVNALRTWNDSYLN